MTKLNSIITTAALAAVVAVPAIAQTQVERTMTTTTTMTTSVVPSNLPDVPTPSMQALLAAYASLEPKPISMLSPREARKQPTLADAEKVLLKEIKAKKLSTRDIEVDSDKYMSVSGDKLPMKIYYTKVDGKGDTPRPVILYFHGGGFVIGSAKAYENSIVALARKTGAIVVAPEYRLAPESRFPAPQEDAISAYKWVVDNIGEYNGDPAKVAVVGESAGGNLATNVGILALSNGLKAPVALGLIYPVAQTDMLTPSYQMYANAVPLSKASMEWFVSQIARPESRAEVLKDPRLSLVDSKLEGLPPTTVITAGIDPIKDDGILLANRLRQSGVPTAYQNFPGVTHEFFGFDSVLPEARVAQDYLAAHLNEQFAK
ncbi:MAG: lipase [Pseudomonas fluorescens]|nr:MAG: lipase [Pseudomonas fluorescens]